MFFRPKDESANAARKEKPKKKKNMKKKVVIKPVMNC